MNINVLNHSRNHGVSRVLNIIIILSSKFMWPRDSSFEFLKKFILKHRSIFELNWLVKKSTLLIFNNCHSSIIPFRRTIYHWLKRRKTFFIIRKKDRKEKLYLHTMLAYSVAINYCATVTSAIYVLKASKKVNKCLDKITLGANR